MDDVEEPCSCGLGSGVSLRNEGKSPSMACANPAARKTQNRSHLDDSNLSLQSVSTFCIIYVPGAPW